MELDKLVTKSEKFSSLVQDNIVSYEKLEEQFFENKKITDDDQNNMNDGINPNADSSNRQKVSLDEVKNLQVD
jgi:hypothetical protein